MSNQTTWVLDPAHSEISFKVKHLMISNVKGIFKEAIASIHTNGDSFENAHVNAELDTNSIDTTSIDRDKHLKSADFFDAENHPRISFKSTAIKKGSNGNLMVEGDLTIKGISKAVTLEAEIGGIAKDPWGNEKAGMSIHGKINRKDWGLNWNAALEAGGVLVGETVHISGDLQFTKQVK